MFGVTPSFSPPFRVLSVSFVLDLSLSSKQRDVLCLSEPWRSSRRLLHSIWLLQTMKRPHCDWRVWIFSHLFGWTNTWIYKQATINVKNGLWEIKADRKIEREENGTIISVRITLCVRTRTGHEGWLNGTMTRHAATGTWDDCFVFSHHSKSPVSYSRPVEVWLHSHSQSTYHILASIEI